MGKGKVRADEVQCPQAASPSPLLPPTWAGGCVLPHPCGQPRGALLSALSAGLAVLRGMDSLQRLKSSVARPVKCRGGWLELRLHAGMPCWVPMQVTVLSKGSACFFQAGGHRCRQS